MNKLFQLKTFIKELVDLDVCFDGENTKNKPGTRRVAREIKLLGLRLLCRCSHDRFLIYAFIRVQQTKFSH